jgi:hypothetical protein
MAAATKAHEPSAAIPSCCQFFGGGIRAHHALVEFTFVVLLLKFDLEVDLAERVQARHHISARLADALQRKALQLGRRLQLARDAHELLLEGMPLRSCIEVPDERGQNSGDREWGQREVRSVECLGSQL